MEFKIRWTDSALADLDEICTYIAEDDNEAAFRVGQGILDKVRQLENFPLSGRVYLADRQPPIREILFHNYRIFYRQLDKSRVVEILAVWHAARRNPDL